MNRNDEQYLRNEGTGMNQNGLDIISCEMSNDVLVQRSHIKDFNAKSQLVVAESQEAIFFKEGQALDLFASGRHSLNSDNLPFIRRIFGRIFGGADKTPFTCDVYFINKVYAMEIPWGTPLPITLNDPEFNYPVGVKSNGQSGLRVKDSRKFVVKVVGQLEQFTVETVKRQIKGMLLTSLTNVIADTIVTEKVGILQISTQLERLSAVMQTRLNEKLDDLGLEAVHFNIGAIFASDEDMAKLKKSREMGLMAQGEADRMRILADAEAERMRKLGYTYQQEQTFRVMETAAANTASAGSMINAGLGLGMGLGVMGEVGKAAGSVMNTSDTNMKACPTCNAQAVMTAKFCATCGNAFPAAKTCPNCSAPVDETAKFCPTCGQSLAAPAAKFCPECGKQLDGATKFCPECGHKF